MLTPSKRPNADQSDKKCIQRRTTPKIEALEGRRLLSAAYTMTDLGTIAGYKDFTAMGLNNTGQVVGYAGKSAVYYDTRGLQGFVYRGGVLQAVGGKNSSANGINDSGQIVGSFAVNGYAHPFLASNSTVKDLYRSIVGSGQTSWSPDLAIAHAINNSGQIAGETLTGYGDQTAWVYGNSSIHSMTGADNSAALAINNKGMTAGFSGSVSYGHGFRAAGSVPQDLGVIGGIFGSSTGYALNDAGLVAGVSDRMDADYNNLPRHAFLYVGGVMRDLGALPGPGDSAAHGLNNQGIVVGSSGGHPFVFRNGKMTDVNSLVTLKPGMMLNDAVAINDRGQIAVNGTIGGHTRAYLLTPIAATGSISGRVFNDVNHNAKRDGSETGMSNVQVYVDSNANGRYDAGECTTSTDAAGNYSLTALAAGAYHVREVTPSTWTASQATAASLKSFDVTVNPTINHGTITGKDFGNYRK
jgi:probable HAF family extracellular repeat protein